MNNATESFSRCMFSLSYRIFSTIRIFFFVHFDVCVIRPFVVLFLVPTPSINSSGMCANRRGTIKNSSLS